MKKKTLYDDLAVEKDATPEQIKKAYRQKAKQTHPDNGGKCDDFRAIAKAYNVLSDEEKRKRYDQGEDPDNINQSNTHEQQVMSTVFNIFNQVVDQNIDFDHNNLFEIVRQNLQINQQNFKNEKDRNQNNIDKYNKILKRIKKKHESMLFIQLLDDKIRGCNATIIQLEHQIKICEDALKLIEECEYKTDAVYRSYQFFTGTSTTAG